uniref:EF-hand domain-containing protein n=1 Tax=Hanusia phi TaxID=3032 RepID=A0A7S0EF35_9CRYP|mmetsp:Transcript_23163/g.52054  ORF Transcript_23163/g.52054 Transcript_23163/m.52054 type:complete len:163 (+) Transcript_23163:116-604(+)
MALLAHERNLLKPDDKFLQEAKTVFVKYDEDKDGFLNLHEAKLGIINLFGYKPSRYELLRLFGERTLQEEQVGWDIFYDAMLRRKIDVGASAVDEVRQAFKAFDRRSAGFLTLADVKNAFREVAPHVSERIIEEIFFEFDEDRDGRLNFTQFERMWRRGAPA